MVTEELEKLGPVATKILKVLVAAGGEMNHPEIVSRMKDAPEADLKEAFVQLRKSLIVWDKWPTPFNQNHIWTVNSGQFEELKKRLQ